MQSISNTKFKILERKKRKEEKSKIEEQKNKIKEYEEIFVLSNLELSKNIFRYILDELPKHEKYKNMTYQDKYLIVKSINKFSDFVNKFPIVVREMFLNNYNEKAFKKFARYIYNYSISPEDRVIMNNSSNFAGRMNKMMILNKKNAKYMYWLHYYLTNKKSKEKSIEVYENTVKELNKDSEKYYNDYLNFLEESKKKEENIKNRYIEEITKSLNIKND